MFTNFASALPECKGTIPSMWTNCHGTLTTASGNKYVGEFKDAKRNGLGAYTFANGTVDKGIWKNNKLIERRNL